MSTGLVRHLLGITLALFSLGVVVPSSSAQTCTVNIPHIDGEWRTLPYLMPINPISATLLNTGRVLIVAGSENDAKNNSEALRATATRSGTRQPQPRAASQCKTWNMMFSAVEQPLCPMDGPWSWAAPRITLSQAITAPPFL